MCLSVCARRAAARSSPLQSFKYSRSSRSFPPLPTFLPNLCSPSTFPLISWLHAAAHGYYSCTCMHCKKSETRAHMESPAEKGAPVVHPLPIKDAARISLLMLGLGSPKETETRRDERARRRQKVTERSGAAEIAWNRADRINWLIAAAVS